MNISSVVPSSDTATDTMTDFEKVNRVRRYLPLLASKWGIHVIVVNPYFPYLKLLFLSSIFKTTVAQKLCGGFC